MMLPLVIFLLLVLIACIAVFCATGKPATTIDGVWREAPDNDTQPMRRIDIKA